VATERDPIRILFVGDLVGDDGPYAGLSVLERALPRARARYRPDAVIVNAENVALTGPSAVGGCGLTPAALERLWLLDVDVVTGGNHSWDGPHAAEVHEHGRVLRPLNAGRRAPGPGALLLDVGSVRLGIVNLASRTAWRFADHPLDALEDQLAVWGDDADAVLVDFHGESVSEKQILAWSVAGEVAAVLGTHTHVATLDARILPGGTAYVSDVGMTGPDGGMQGYDPEPFVDTLRTRLPSRRSSRFADGPAVLGAVLLEVADGHATAIERVDPDLGGTP
jgi:hypothetical protein